MSALDYATLILHDAKLAVTADNLVALCNAAGVKVEKFKADLYASTLEKKKVDSILSVSVAAAPAAAAAAPVAAAVAAAPAKKVEEKKEESDDDMGMGLFD
ncbi:hypothetical protein ACTFIU_010185 [Dictyostelium citrinum]